jgi:MFS-type transporter involved in bile tolerance (Atg22 family)
VITADGSGFTVTALLSVSAQPLELVIVTVYVPLVVTDIAEVVAEVDHKYPVPPVAVSTTDSPWQNDVGPFAAMTADGSGLTVTTELSVSAQPLELVTVTVYVPPEFTLIAAVVAVVDHR